MADLTLELPRLASGEPDVDVWLDEASGLSSAHRKMAMRVFDLIKGHESCKQGLALLELLLQLKMDAVTAMTGMAFFAVRHGHIQAASLPSEVEHLVASVLRLSTTNVLAFNDSAVLSSESKSQADNVRHLLISLIDDPRVAVIKLAERVVVLRELKHSDCATRQATAREAMEFFAPLAGRLGIWQLKWSLEDLAFRYLYPQEYLGIVAKLDGRRAERERQVEAIRQDLIFRLSSAGIDAQVYGRAKHLYSIWNKMSHKSIDFSEVRDVQAVRVLVDHVDDCYRAMGVVHTSWPHLPSEFDDYIANPKENGYRSLHTAVIGPAGKTLEVQIRTRAMHEESELGMCAHWAYKNGGGKAGQDVAREDALQSQKIDWLRSVLEWLEEHRRRAPDDATVNGFGPATKGVFGTQDRIFVTTPQGHVLDLAPSATPVDFAYRIHTEIGHRCRSARVDGREVPLNRRLATGECVEIDTGETAAPRREWLNPALGYVNTSRARSKIQSWFRAQVSESNIRAGRALLMETLARLHRVENLKELAALAGYRCENDMLLAIGVGELLVIDLLGLTTEPVADAVLSPSRNPPDDADALHGLTVRGKDRDGLLRDILTAVAGASVSVVAANARAEAPGERATVSLELRAASAKQLQHAIEDIRRTADVFEVRDDRIHPHPSTA